MVVMMGKEKENRNMSSQAWHARTRQPYHQVRIRLTNWPRPEGNTKYRCSRPSWRFHDSSSAAPRQKKPWRPLLIGLKMVQRLRVQDPSNYMIGRRR
jgi:hypothetical protein